MSQDRSGGDEDECTRDEHEGDHSRGADATHPETPPGAIWFPIDPSEDGGTDRVARIRDVHLTQERILTRNVIRVRSAFGASLEMPRQLPLLVKRQGTAIGR
jgi:hypothetical protein